MRPKVDRQRVHYNARIASIVCLGALAAAGCDQPTPHYDGAQHVILISLDTARADSFGFMGNEWIYTPRLDSLAEESIVFAAHSSVVPTTLASHTSIFTGKYPHHHGTPRNGFMVNPQNEMLPEILKRAGFRTAGFAGSFALASRFDFAQGFDHYSEDFEIRVGDGGADQNQRDARALTDAVIEYLDQTDMPQRLFLFVHYFDPHRPYRVLGPFFDHYRKIDIPLLIHEKWRDHELDGRAQVRGYAAEVSYMDHHIGRLLLELRMRRILDRAILILTSDHGETFLEHPAPFNHGREIYRTTTRALWLIRLPGAELSGTRVDALTSSIDILPTLLDALSLPVPPGIDGIPYPIRNGETGNGEAPAARSVFSQATQPLRNVETDPRWRNLRKARSIRRGRYKLIQTPFEESEELYALDLDPDERENLLTNPTVETLAVVAGLREELETWAASAQPLPSHFESEQAEETYQRLKSLGYLQDR